MASNLDNVKVEISVVLGRSVIPMHQLLRMGRGAVIELDTHQDDPVTILANDKPVAKGEIQIQGDKIVARGDFGPMLPSPLVFTINKDGTIDGPRDSMIPRLEKAK